MTASILHVKGRSKRFTERCGCEVAHCHDDPAFALFGPCKHHRECGIVSMQLFSRGKWHESCDSPPFEVLSQSVHKPCGCELQYRGREGGTSMIPCPKHRSAFFAGLHALGLMKEADK